MLFTTQLLLVLYSERLKCKNVLHLAIHKIKRVYMVNGKNGEMFYRWLDQFG